MNNDFVLSVAATLIPALAIVFVALLLSYKVFIQIRSKFDATVNCWFCNQNARVAYRETNSWTCPHCEQYNGFTKDGDYNREIFEQLDCSNLCSSRPNYSGTSASSVAGATHCMSPGNGFCGLCNEVQRIKVEKLAQFEPKNESHFDDELREYKDRLEKEYRLCDTCERHLKRVLRDKKKMVLGSKFLDFIMKGAEQFKQPHFNQVRQAQNQQWKTRIAVLIALSALGNLCCLCGALPPLERDRVIGVFGEALGQPIFIALSHVVTLGRVLATYWEVVASDATVIKVGLFFRTVCVMVLYSMGLKLPQIAGINFGALYVLAAPFAVLGLAFAHHVVDGLKLTRYTFLLLLWSVFAGGLVEEHVLLMLGASLVTLLLAVTGKTEASPKLRDSDAHSFHKMYSEDYLSDEDTMSLLSQQFDCSSASMRSISPNRSYRVPAPYHTATSAHQHFSKSPLAASMFSLNNLPARSQLSPNASFKSFCVDDGQLRRSQYAASMCNFANGADRSPATAAPRASLFTSNMELGRAEQPEASVFGYCPRVAANAAALNNSFVEPMRCQQQRSSAFANANSIPDFTASDSVYGAPYAPQQLGGFAQPPAASRTNIQSPFSASSNAVYPDRPTSSLLMPSRFGANPSAPSWLSGGYFSQQQAPVQFHATATPHHLFEHRNGGTTGNTENLSRASSRSSGFESQTGRLNVSRENSLCPDTADIIQRSASLDIAKTFQPIDESNMSDDNRALLSGASAFARRPPLHLNASAFAQPLSVNCGLSSAALFAAQSQPPQMDFLRTSSLGLRSCNGRDSFNLRKINEELPTIKRGDLLQKWKEGQTIA